ncbi:hypothetical protein M885DRAFT_514497 [Pelagophyceae sp. CCMP2097]|nr:hypothetical protein M885DRAFT_514497 [Pelagophyceae sp. CCMP2097]|mmetsp:Transcript_18740/g.63319  ORF Transcript_18740/g.63319 Transcript_18740/m.63319 type:complete len:142 (+) Transcript_18740:87-512(+)
MADAEEVPKWKTLPLFDDQSEAAESYGAEMMAEFVADSRGEFEQAVQQLRDKAALTQDSEDWKVWHPWKIAHSVKGLAASLGIARLAAYAKSVEDLKLTIDPATAAGAAELFESLYEATRLEYAEYALTHVDDPEDDGDVR